MSKSKYRYLYRVTRSTEPAIKVGSLLIETDRLLRRDWAFVGTETGTTTHVVGVRLNRLCLNCHDEFRQATEYGHAGECGPETPKVVPSDGKGSGLSFLKQDNDKESRS